MQSYYWLAVVLHFGVNFMLIMAINGIFSYSMAYLRGAAAAALAATYALLCLLPQFRWMVAPLGRAVVLLAVCWIAFGIGKSTGRSCLLFCLLRLALDGIGGNQVLWAAALCGGMLWVFQREKRGCSYLPVVLHHRGKSIKLTALYDTGHDLRDPISGSSVLVVDGAVSHLLTELSGEELSDPIKTMQEQVGYCLLPYKTVGHPTGFLLGVRIRNGKIGRRKGSVLVALCPDILDEKGKFQGLIGGKA